MNKKRVDKLYSGLTPHEQAALAFGAAVRKDAAELDAITASVERKTYIDVHMDYDRRLRGLQALAMEYGLSFWQALSVQYAMSMLCLTDDENRHCLTRVTEKLQAMDTALSRVCQDLRIDPDTIKKATRHTYEYASRIGQHDVDEALVAQYVKIFREVAML